MSVGGAHDAAVWAGHFWKESWPDVQLLEFLLWWPHEHCTEERQGPLLTAKPSFRCLLTTFIQTQREHVGLVNTRLVFNPHTEQTMSYCCLGILGLFIAHLKSQPNHTCFMTNELITWTVCVPLFTGAHYWPVYETNAYREQPLPQRAEDDAQPAGGGLEALEITAQATEQWEKSLGTQVCMHS